MEEVEVNLPAFELNAVKSFQRFCSRIAVECCCQETFNRSGKQSAGWKGKCETQKKVCGHMRISDKLTVQSLYQFGKFRHVETYKTLYRLGKLLRLLSYDWIVTVWGSSLASRQMTKKVKLGSYTQNQEKQITVCDHNDYNALSTSNDIYFSINSNLLVSTCCQCFYPS